MRATRLSRLIEERAAGLPDAVYLEDARSARSITFGELADRVRDEDARLTTNGMPPGADVVIDEADSLAFATSFLAAIAAGRCAVPIDPSAPAAQKARLCDNGAPARPGAAVRLHTSGSSGEPKGVELTEAQLLAAANAIAAHNELRVGDRGYNALPLFHINAEVVGLLASLVAGSTLVLDRKFRRRDFWELMTERRISWINAVPAILSILVQEPLPIRPAGLRFIRSASAPLPGAVRETFTEAFGPIVLESYGMTEAASQITATALPPARSPRGSVGPAIGVQLELRSGDGHPVGLGEVGRIWIRGESVVGGYAGGRASERFDEHGWLDTGDLGRLDAGGNLTHAGRADDVINRGGELVYPREVEEVLLGDARVVDAAVVARPDDVLGEVPVAYLVTRGREPGLTASLTARCVEQLSRYKCPAELVLVAELPRAATGKVLRSALQAAHS